MRRKNAIYAGDNPQINGIFPRVRLAQHKPE